MVNFILCTPRTASTYVLIALGSYLLRKNLIDDILGDYIHRASNCIEHYTIGPDTIEFDRTDYGVTWEEDEWQRVLEQRVQAFARRPNRYLVKFFGGDLYQEIRRQRLVNIFREMPITGIALERRNLVDHFLSYCLVMCTGKNYHYKNKADEGNLVVTEEMFKLFNNHVVSYRAAKRRMGVSQVIYVEDLPNDVVPALVHMGFEDAKEVMQRPVHCNVLDLPKRTIYSQPRLDYFVNKSQIEAWIKVIETW